MGLRKGSEIKRRTVTEVGRVIVHPEEGAAANAVRRVTVILPESPPVALALGPMELSSSADLPGIDNAGARPEDVAEGRAFQWPEPDAGQEICIHVLPHQWFAAISTMGFAKVTVLVEYLDGVSS